MATVKWASWVSGETNPAWPGFNLLSALLSQRKIGRKEGRKFAAQQARDNLGINKLVALEPTSVQKDLEKEFGF